MYNFIILKIKKMIWNILGGYNPRIFWNKWGETFINESWQHKIFPQHKSILNFVKNENPENILEIGCGFGRNINYLINNGINPGSITGIDISESMIDSARSFLKNNKIKLKVADVILLPFKENSFDFVLSYSVLMHISKEKLDKALSEIIRVAKKNIIIVEQNYKPKKTEEASWYTFIHDYKKNLKNKKARIVKYKKDKINGYDIIYLLKIH